MTAFLYAYAVLVGGFARRYFGGGPLWANGELPVGRIAQLVNMIRRALGQQPKFGDDGRDSGGRGIGILIMIAVAAGMMGVWGPKVPAWELALFSVLYGLQWTYTGHGSYLFPPNQKTKDDEDLASVVRAIAGLIGVKEFADNAQGESRMTNAYGILGMATVYGIAALVAGGAMEICDIAQGRNDYCGWVLMPAGFVAGGLSLGFSLSFGLPSVNIRPFFDWRYENPWFEIMLGATVTAAWAAAISL